MPDDDQIGPGFSRGTFDFRNGIAKVHAKLRCQPHGGKSLMAFVEDRPEIGLLVDQRAGIRALRQRVARDCLDHCEQDYIGAPSRSASRPSREPS